MVAIRELAGVASPDDKAAPCVDITRPISELARHVGALLSSKPFFRMNERLVEVDEETGEVEALDPDSFRSRVEEFAVVGKPREVGFHACSMSRDTAKAILASKQFRKLLRPLNGVQTVRVPVWNADRSRAELLPPGYHEPSGIFTVDLLPYRTDMDETEAAEFLKSYFEEGAWFEDGPLESKRSFCAHLAGMFSAFMLEMFPPEVGRMGFFYTANQRGAGKSTLAESAMAPVFGAVTAEGWGRDEERIKKDLDTAALEGARYLFLDNVTGTITSAHLARFITASSIKFRMLGSNKSGVGWNRRVVFLTGNGARADGDLESRLLQVQLHVACDAVERLGRLKHPITKEDFTSPERRKQFLAALWALVDHWNHHGCRLASTTYTRFPDWEGIVGGVLECAGFGCAFTKPELGMDDVGEAWGKFFKCLAGEMDQVPTTEFTVDDCIEVARKNDLLEDMLPTARDKEDKKLNHAFGTWVRRRYASGWQFTHESGRLCEFRKAAGRGRAGSIYTVSFIDEPQA